jgi:hypothetical protein
MPEITGMGGAVVSTTHVRVVGELSVLSVCFAVTENVWEDCDKPEYEIPELQVVEAAPSREHLNVDPDGPVKVNVADVLFVGLAGPDVIVGASVTAGFGAANAPESGFDPVSTTAPTETASTADAAPSRPFPVAAPRIQLNSVLQ